MVRALNLRYQILMEFEQMAKYGADDHGYPFTAICDSAGYPIEKIGHFMSVGELMDKIQEVVKSINNGESNA